MRVLERFERQSKMPDIHFAKVHWSFFLLSIIILELISVFIVSVAFHENVQMITKTASNVGLPQLHSVKSFSILRIFLWRRSYVITEYLPFQKDAVCIWQLKRLDWSFFFKKKKNEEKNKFKLWKIIIKEKVLGCAMYRNLFTFMCIAFEIWLAFEFSYFVL